MNQNELPTTKLPNRFKDAISVQEVMFQAIGAGSTCWDGDGWKSDTFNSEEASRVGEEALQRIQEIQLSQFREALWGVPDSSIHTRWYEDDPEFQSFDIALTDALTEEEVETIKDYKELQYRGLKFGHGSYEEKSWQAILEEKYPS